MPQSVLRADLRSHDPEAVHLARISVTGARPSRFSCFAATCVLTILLARGSIEHTVRYLTAPAATQSAQDPAGS